MLFSIDERIASTSIYLGDWPLSAVYLKNEAHYPWLILVPRKKDIKELYELSKQERFMLMEEINHLSVLMNDYFKPDKLNVGALGNIVSQLHIHIIARNKKDNLWPQGIWQASMTSINYTNNELERLVPSLQQLINSVKRDQF